MKDNFLVIFIIVSLNIIGLGLFKRELNIKFKIKNLFRNQEKFYSILLVLSFFSLLYFIESELKGLNNNLLLKELKKYMDSDRVLYVYLGVVSFLLAIYIYCIGVGDSFKKQIIIYSIGEGTILYLPLTVLLVYLLNMPNIYIFSLFILTFYELYKIIDLIFFISSPSRFSDEFNKIIFKFRKTDKKRGLKDLSYEIKKNIFLSLNEEDYIGFEEGLIFYLELLKGGFLETIEKNKIKILQKEKSKRIDYTEPQKNENNIQVAKFEDEDENIKNIEKEQDLTIEFIYKIYKHFLRKPNDQLFFMLEQTTRKLAEYYLEKDLKKYSRYAQIYYNFLLERYKYILLKKDGKLEFGFLSGYLYLEGISEEKKIIINNSLLNVVNEIIRRNRKDDYLFIKAYFNRMLNESNITKIDLYTNIIIIYILISNDKKEWDKDFETKFIFVDIEILQELFIKSDEYEKKFEVYKFNFNEPDILGQCEYNNKNIELKNIILEIMDKNINDLTEKFILEYYDKLQWRVREKNFKNIERQILSLQDKIKEKEAIKISNIKLKKEEIESYFSKLFDYNSSCYSFISNYLCKDKKRVVTIDEKLEEWKNKAKGYNILFQNDIILELQIAQQYINILDEYFFINSCLGLAEDLEYSEINFEKKWCMFIHRDDYIKLDRLKLDSQIKIYVLKNYNGLKKPILIPMKSIDLILEILPEKYINNKNAYIEIETPENMEDPKLLELIKEDNIENKKLILKGSSLLKIYKNIEIYFEDNIKIYTLINLPEKKNK